MSTTGFLTTAPVPRMPTWGWLMIGVSISAPREPVLVMVNVPPESSSGVILFAPGAVGHVGDLAGEPGEVEVPGVVDHRHDQAGRRVDGDAQVLGAVVGDLALLGVDHRVDHAGGP